MVRKTHVVSGFYDSETRDALRQVFSEMTIKQHEVLRFVSDNWTSKEIAHELGISESAINQRIEGIRGRTAFPSRAQLARAYRQYLQAK